MKFSVIGSALLMAAVLASGAQAADGKMDARAQKRLADIEAKYEKTGEMKHCIPLRMLGNSSIIDDQTIFFKGIGKTAYMNHLPHRCPRLASEERFMYKTWIGQLCSSDIITVLDSFGREWGSCGLGEFEVMQKKAKTGDDSGVKDVKDAGQQEGAGDSK